MVFTIYKITNLINGKLYIGFTSCQDPFKRWAKHIAAAKKNCSYLLHRAIRKYGTKTFVFEPIFQSLDGVYTLKTMEPYFIHLYNSYTKNIGYNMTFGGEGTLGRLHSDDTKRKIGEKSKSRVDSPETIVKKSKHLAQNNPFRGKFGDKNSNSCEYEITFSNSTIITIIGLQHFSKTNHYNRRSLYKLLNGEIKYHRDIASIIRKTI